MLEKYFRPIYQTLFLDPLARALVCLPPISPNMITFLGCFLGLICAFFIAIGWHYLALLFLLLSGGCDTLDGTLARQTNRVSQVGTVWDIVCDRIVEAALVIGLFLYAPDARALLSLLMMTSILLCITSFLVVGIFSENQTEKGFYYSPGIIERGEAFVFFASMILLPSYFVILSLSFTFLVLLTAVIRLIQFATILRS